MAIVMRTAGHHIDQATFLGLTQHLDKLHGPRVAPLSAALVEERRRNTIVRLRSSVTDPEIRFFLAVLMSFSDRVHTIRAMAERYDPSVVPERIAEGVATALGGDGTQRVITSALTMAMLGNVPPSDVSAWVMRHWNRSLSGGERENLQRYYQQMLHHPLLAPLASEDGSVFAH